MVVIKQRLSFTPDCTVVVWCITVLTVHVSHLCVSFINSIAVKLQYLSVLPVSVGEDKPTELQISQHDSMLMTVPHSIQHLSEQVPRLLLTQTLPASDICMHVTMMARQEDVHSVLANHHVQQSADVLMVTNPSIGNQTLLVTTQGKDL